MRRSRPTRAQPIHIWRLDYSAHNHTGKPLDYLTASFFIEAPNPPCTNWSGEGPGGGPSGDVTDDEGIPAHPLWGDELLTLPKPSGLGVGEVARDTEFLLVFHADRPVFKELESSFHFCPDQVPGPGCGYADRAAAPSEGRQRHGSSFPPTSWPTSICGRPSSWCGRRTRRGLGRPCRSS